MEIGVFAKCIKELIVENDRVDVPYLGSFTAELMPATYSDRQTTIHPPYRKMSFHKGEVSLAEGRLLLDKVRRELGVNLDQAGVELGWCLSRLNSELEGRKRCPLPGLGMMRANARNEFFFVPDDDLDIWPDGIGFEPIAIKMPKEEMPDQVGHDDQTETIVETPEPVVEDKPELLEAGVGGPGGDFAVSDSQACLDAETQNRVEEARVKEEDYVQVGHDEPELRLHWGWIVLIVLAVLLVLFIAASYLFTEQMSPILDRLLYSKEELELLQWRKP
ncbi:MAG: hypothetical protein II002_04555 [Bacteroidales bacterium]|nr:hypothetical protein [Bacteroidales bacterium]